jgi:hypothetical protein
MDFSAERMVLGEELMPLVKERLAAGQTIRYFPFRGVSMLPMLRQGKDMVELSPLPDKLQKYDLPVYQYPSGKYVMHRVVAVKEDHYICLGDNTYEYEKIKPEQMIGLVSAFKRGEKRIDVKDPMYRFYCRIWCAIFPLRKLLKRVKRCLRRILK